MGIFGSRLKLLPAMAAAAVLLALPVAAQSTPDAGAVATPMPGAGMVTLHASARLIVVDVAVTDAQGKPVHGLTGADFHLAESGHAQALRSFEEHTSAGQAGPGKPKLQPGVFTNVGSDTGRPTPVILLVDSLNTPMQNQAWVRKQLLDALAKAPADTRMALFSLNTSLVMLQGFTSDHARMRAAIEAFRPQASPLLGEKVGGKGDVSYVAGRDLCPAPSPLMQVTCTAFDEAGENVDAHQRATSTLHALHQLAVYLAGLPGRKSLLWFSQAFPLNLVASQVVMNLANGSLIDPRTGDAELKNEYHDTVDLLTRSRVSIYPFDARGLAFSNNADPNETRTAVYNAQSAMQEIAEDTGGQALVNGNGMAQAVVAVMAGGSDYYTLSYAPTDPAADGRFRPITLRLDKAQGAKLAYRRGYYSQPGSSAQTALPVSLAPGSAGPGTGIQSSAMQAASSYLAGPATQIPFFARVLPMAAQTDAQTDGKTDGKKVAGSRRFSIEYSTELRGLQTAAGEDGVHRAHIEFIALVYDAQGRIVGSDVKAMRIAWTPEQFQAALEHGLRYQQQINVAGDGSSTLRVFVHDLLNDEVGSLEVPGALLKAQ